MSVQNAPTFVQPVVYQQTIRMDNILKTKL